MSKERIKELVQQLERYSLRDEMEWHNDNCRFRPGCCMATILYELSCLVNGFDSSFDSWEEVFLEQYPHCEKCKCPLPYPNEAKDHVCP